MVDGLMHLSLSTDLAHRLSNSVEMPDYSEIVDSTVVDASSALYLGVTEELVVAVVVGLIVDHITAAAAVVVGNIADVHLSFVVALKHNINID